ncbi:MAG: molybdate ABC transporter substrate-binding protein [Acidimicrobiales bacterium]
MVVVIALLGGGCGDSDGDDQTVLVFAAASLTDVFAEIETAFEATTPGVDVQFNLGGSSSLREQILAGAPADVFASANTETMDRVVEAGAVDGEIVVFARNRLAIAVPAGNPGEVASLADLADADLLIGLCSAGVPCGDFARQVLAAAGVEPSLDTNEPDVRSLLTKIAAGELDAGIVYETDVIVAGADVERIEIPADVNVEAPYPAAVISGAPQPDLAAAFVEFLVSADARAILADAGFLPA